MIWLSCCILMERRIRSPYKEARKKAEEIFDKMNEALDKKDKRFKRVKYESNITHESKI